MKSPRLTHLASAIALIALGSHSLIAQAQEADPTKEFVKKVNEATGLEFWGYARGGFYSGDKDKGRMRGGYALGGDLQKFRLGNEGDNFIEFGMGKRFDLGDGLKWGVFYQPKVYNGDSGTAQLYTSMTGIMGSSTTLWAGQRYHRIQDVHIVDHWVMEDGDNYGAGIDDIPVGSIGKLNIALHSSDSIDNKASNPNDASRLNLQWHKIPVNPGGTLTLTAGFISGDFAQGSDGGAIGLLHNQSDFLVKGLNNSLFLQASSGHASVNGKFYGLDNAGVSRAGARQRRIVDVLDFQSGKFGGQALVGYQTTRPDAGNETKDFTLGGRVSYGLAKHAKLLGEVGTTRRETDNMATQRLNKATIAVAFAPNTDFWTRPEFRIYATRASWNAAAATANPGTFGLNGRRNANTVGVQMEAWWN